MDLIKHDKDWFTERVGQRVFRTKGDCYCDACEKVYLEGLIIQDKQHAQYLYDCQNELGLYYYTKNKQHGDKS